MLILAQCFHSDDKKFGCSPSNPHTLTQRYCHPFGQCLLQTAQVQTNKLAIALPTWTAKVIRPGRSPNVADLGKICSHGLDFSFYSYLSPRRVSVIQKYLLNEQQQQEQQNHYMCTSLRLNHTTSNDITLDVKTDILRWFTECLPLFTCRWT